MQVSESAVAVAKVGVDAAMPGHMAGIICVGQGEAFQDTELRFNQVEPGSFRGCPDGMDSETPQQRKKTGMIMDIAQIVQNYIQLLSRITTAQAGKSFADIYDRLATTE